MKMNENNGISGSSLGSTYLNQERMRPLYGDKKVLIDGVLKFPIIGYISYKEWFRLNQAELSRKGRY